MPEISEHLRGPWQAFLATEDSEHIFTSLADVPEGIEPAVTVLRGEIRDAALTGVMPDGVEDFDELDILYLVEPDDAEDWERQLPVRWEQALAVAEAMNARSGRSANEPGA